MSAARRLRTAVRSAGGPGRGASPRGASLLAALVLLAIGAAGARAQQVERTGRGMHEWDQRLDEVLAGSYTLVSENALVAAGDTLRGPVLVAGATLRVNGTIEGDVWIVDANLFLRPSAVVTGTVHNLGGGYFPSEQAQVAGVRDEPLAPYEVERLADGRLRILGTRHRSALVLDGVRGVRIPTYDRVDGLTLGLGAGLLTPPLGSIEPMVRGWIEYRFERGEFTGGGELSAARGRTTVAVGAERTTATEDRWIRGDLTNSVSVIWDGDDHRNYYESDRAWVELRRVLERTDRVATAFLRLQAEEATSLSAGDPWIIRAPDSIRPNPAVFDGRITSVVSGGTLSWEQPRLRAELEAEAEFALDALDGERSFNRFEINGAGAVPGLANHSIMLQVHLRGPLPGTDSLPRQRWSMIGGSGTLPTFDIGEFTGDRVVFGELRYMIPLPEYLRVPLVGVPSFNLLHASGTAWTAEQKRAVRHNFGAELRWPFFYGRILFDPEDIDTPKLNFGVSFPRRSLPWTR